MGSKRQWIRAVLGENKWIITLRFLAEVSFTIMEKLAGQADLGGPNGLCVSAIQGDIWNKQFNNESGDQGRGLSQKLTSRQWSE